MRRRVPQEEAAEERMPATTHKSVRGEWKRGGEQEGREMAGEGGSPLEAETDKKGTNPLEKRKKRIFLCCCCVGPIHPTREEQ